MTIFNPPPASQLQRRASRFYPTYNSFSVTTITVSAVDTLYVTPFFLGVPQDVKTLSIRVVTGGAASSVKVGLWASSGTVPIGAPLAANNTGASTTASSTTVTLDVTDIVLASGIYWTGTKFTGTLPVCLGIHVSDFAQMSFLGGTAIANGAVTALQLAAAYANDMPTFTGEEAWLDFASNGVPIMFLGT